MNNPPSSAETAKEAGEIVDTLLGHLGIPVQIEENAAEDTTPTLHLFSAEAENLIGRRGERLDDLQYLANRLLHQRDPSHGRVRIDIEHYKAKREARMLEKVRSRADHVRLTRESVTLNPMNSYDRCLVHEAFKDDPEVISASSSDREKFKSITLSYRIR